MTKKQITKIIKANFKVSKVVDFANGIATSYVLNDDEYDEIRVWFESSYLDEFKPHIIYYIPKHASFYDDKYNLGHIKEFQFREEMKEIIDER